MWNQHKDDEYFIQKFVTSNKNGQSANKIVPHIQFISVNCWYGKTWNWVKQEEVRNNRGLQIKLFCIFIIVTLSFQYPILGPQNYLIKRINVFTLKNILLDKRIWFSEGKIISFIVQKSFILSDRLFIWMEELLSLYH